MATEILEQLGSGQLKRAVVFAGLAKKEGGAVLDKLDVYDILTDDSLKKVFEYAEDVIA